MRRPAIFCAAAFSAGVVFAACVSFPPEWAWSALCLCLIPSLFLVRRKRFYLALLAGFFLLGALREGLTRIVPADDISKLAGEGKGAITGRIDSLPEIRMRGRREKIAFALSVQIVETGGRTERRQGKVQVSVFNSGALLQYGDRVRIFGELKTPPAAVSAGQFDYRKYLANRGIRRVFLAFGKKSVRVLGESDSSFFKKIISLRTAILRKIDTALPFPENQILAALLVGARKGIPPGISDDFVKTGTTHILAVSGMNVSIVSGFIYLLLRLCFIPRRVNALFCLLFIGAYVLLSGCNAPVARAGIMGGLLMLGLFLEKDSELANSLAIAFFILLFANPGNLWACDFQLSFLAVLGIHFFGPGLENECLIDDRGKKEAPAPLVRLGRFYRDILWVTFAAMLGTWPLLLYYFRLFSPVSFLANLAILPLMNFATFAGFLVLPFLFLWEKAGVLVGIIPMGAIHLSVRCNHRLAGIPFGHFYLPAFGPGILWLYYGLFFPALMLFRARFVRLWKARARAKKTPGAY